MEPPRKCNGLHKQGPQAASIGVRIRPYPSGPVRIRPGKALRLCSYNVSRPFAFLLVGRKRCQVCCLSQATTWTLNGAGWLVPPPMSIAAAPLRRRPAQQGVGTSFRQGMPESRHRDVNQRRIAILGYWTPANPPGADLDARSAGRSPNRRDAVSNPCRGDASFRYNRIEYYSASDAKSASRERSPRKRITWPLYSHSLKRSTA